MSVQIRTFQPGDEAAQAAIYNAAAATLPGFKTATSAEIRRRTTAPDFDPASRFYAVSGDEVVGYCTVGDNGRIGYPWCRPGHAVETALFNAALDACMARGVRRVFSAYRTDWTEQGNFFLANGFVKAREIVNFAQNLIDLPTLVIRRGLNVAPIQERDFSLLANLVPNLIRLPEDRLAQFFGANPYYPPDSLFVLRRANGVPQGFGVLIENEEYADPMAVDSAAPCFRLGAFGTEGMTTKRVKGLFSFLVRNDSDATTIGLDLLSYALSRIQGDSVETLAAQAPSDVPHLLGFYQKYFRKQGSFPVYERSL